MTKPNLKMIKGRDCDKCYYGGENARLRKKPWYGRLVIDIHCSRTKINYVEVPRTVKNDKWRKLSTKEIERDMLDFYNKIKDVS